MATPVAPAPLPHARRAARTRGAGGVPPSHVVEPVVGEPVPAAAGAATAAAGTRGSGTSRGGPRAGSILSPADRASFVRLTASLGGRSGAAVSALGRGHPVERAGELQSAVAWSTAKVPIAMAVVAAGDGAAEQADLLQAITASDNAAALRLWSALGGGRAAADAADEQLRAAGDVRTRIEWRSLRGAGYTPFGQTTWALDDQARFAAGLACTKPGAAVLALMEQVVPGQRWGLGAAGVATRFKGGWGPGSLPGADGGYLDRQMGVLTVHGRPLGIAIATEPADGSHETGLRALTAIARWIVAHADTRGLPSRATRCGG